MQFKKIIDYTTITQHDKSHNGGKTQFELFSDFCIRLLPEGHLGLNIHEGSKDFHSHPLLIEYKSENSSNCVLLS